MTLPRARDWLFSIKTFIAAMLAVYIGFATALPRPYWAMATVYICSQPLSGATRSKAAYRVAGTLIGAVVAVGLVPNLVNAPVLLVGAIALWVASCLYFSLLDRSPRSYTFMLAGYTAALIGFPSVLDPGAIFDTAVARVEEITLGILCASVVSALLLPSSVGAVVSARTNRWLANAARLSLDVLSGHGTDEHARGELLRLAGDAAEIDMLSTHLAYDTSNSRDVRRHIEALRLRMLMLLPILSSIVDRLRALGIAEPEDIPADIAQAIEHVRGWISPSAPSLARADRIRDAEAVDRLRQTIDAAQEPLGARSGWDDLLKVSLLLRLRELVDTANDTRILRRAIAGHRAHLSGRLAFNAGTAVLLVRHRDHAMALLSAIGVAIAILITSAFWIETGWPDGSAAPMMAAVACCFFASRDDPVPAILQFATWTGVAVALMAVYQFAIFPLVHDFEILTLVLAPALLLFGVLISMPATMGIGMALAANGTTVLALQGSFSADFGAYVNSNMALLLGMYAAAIVTRLVRSAGAEWAVLRLVRAGRGSLAQAAVRRGRRDRARFAGLMLDRIGLAAPRLAALDPNSIIRAIDPLGGLRVGLNIVDLRRARHELPEPAVVAIDRVLDGLAAHYRKRPGARTPELLDRLDQALTAVTPVEDGPGKRDALLGLVGIRRVLFPDALPYAAAGPERPQPERVAA